MKKLVDNFYNVYVRLGPMKELPEEIRTNADIVKVLRRFLVQNQKDLAGLTRVIDDLKKKPKQKRPDLNYDLST